jgi:hypothetical protein
MPVLVRNEVHSIHRPPPSLRLRSGQAQPFLIKEERVLMVDLVCIISNHKRYNAVLQSLVNIHRVIALLV